MAVHTMTPKDVASELGIAPDSVKSAILNGTMPIGLVIQNDGSSRTRTVIIRERYEAWVNARDLGGKAHE